MKYCRRVWFSVFLFLKREQRGYRRMRISNLVRPSIDAVEGGLPSKKIAEDGVLSSRAVDDERLADSTHDAIA
jgi:hypothetical protein